MLLIVDGVMLGHRDHAVLLDRPGHRHAHHPGEVGIFGEVLEVAPGDGGAVQANTGALEHVLAQRSGLVADDVAVLDGQVGIKTGGQSDGHRQRGGRRGRGAVAHAHPDRTVADPEPGNAQFVDGLDVALDPDLRSQLFHLFGRRRLGGEGVDVDGFHGAMQLGDLLLQGHGGDQPLGSLAWGQGGVKPETVGRGHCWSSSLKVLPAPAWPRWCPAGTAWPQVAVERYPAKGVPLPAGRLGLP